MNPITPHQLLDHAAERRNQLLADLTAERARRSAGVGVIHRLARSYRLRRSVRGSLVAAVGRTAEAT
jgi:hypothetical protein